MTIATRVVQLTDAELALLDGRVRSEIQKEVDAAKDRLGAIAHSPGVPAAVAAFAADLRREALEKGFLVWQPTHMRSCSTCDVKPGYAIRKRDSMSGRKGTSDWSKPHYLHGIEFASRFVRMDGHPALGICNGCVGKWKDYLAGYLRSAKACLPKWLTGRDSEWLRFDRVKCKTCAWQGHEGECGRLPTLMGSGTYPGVCPKCGAKSEPFGPLVFDKLDGFEIVAAPEVKA